ncbi:MAG TPA: hypothetical protein VIM59_05415, partial [Cellvibrio sp.]
MVEHGSLCNPVTWLNQRLDPIPMLTTLIIIFVIAYLVIALEHPLKINKAATALAGAGLMWTVYALLSESGHLSEELSETLINTAQIV